MKIATTALIFLASNWGYSQLLNEGLWIGRFQYNDVEIPFTFAAENTIDQNLKITLINGDDRQILKNVTIEGDSLFILLSPFDAVLRAKFTETQMIGIWRKNYRKGDIPFVATFGGSRFVNENKPYLTIKRKWAIELKPGTPDRYAAIGLFEQEKNKVNGTIITEIGDFRFFEGLLNNDSIKMSSFDGVHGFLIEGEKNGSRWEGKFHFDKSYSEKWIAYEDSIISLEDPFEMVVIDEIIHKPYYDLLGAGSGKNAIDVSKYQDKVVIIQVFGTWCPNSYDQTRFLVDWYKSKSDEVEIVASSFEPNYSKRYGLKRISDYKSDLEIPYEIYLGGKLSKLQAAFPFPFMDRINAFPTLVILDKSGFARYVHSYFSGQATGEYFQEFEIKLNNIIDKLLKEQ